MIQKDSFGLRSRDRVLEYSFQEECDPHSLQEQVRALRRAVEPLLELKELLVGVLRQLRQQEQLAPLLQGCQQAVSGLRAEMIERFDQLEARLQSQPNKENNQANRPPRPRIPSSEGFRVLAQDRSSSTVGEVDLNHILVKTTRMEKKDYSSSKLSNSHIEDRKRLLEQDLEKKLREENDRRRQVLGCRVSDSRVAREYSTRQDKRGPRIL